MLRFLQVNYLDQKSFIFRSDLSTGTLDDMVYTLNIPLVAMDKLVRTKVPGDLGKSLLQPILEGLLDKHNEKLGKQSRFSSARVRHRSFRLGKMVEFRGSLRETDQIPLCRRCSRCFALTVVHRRVNQLLFEGYDVPMLGELAKLATAFIPDAKFPKTNRFGLLYNKNNSAEQSFTVGTGAGKYPFTSVLDWNNNTYGRSQNKY